MASSKARRGSKKTRRPGGDDRSPQAHASPEAPATETAPPTSARWLALLPAIAPLLALAIGSVFFYAFTADDAYITVRYADHLLSGDGLVFNPGERVEGFSNPLQLLLVAGLGGLGASLVGAAKVLGLVAAAGVAVCTGALARRLGAGAWLAGAVSLAVALHPGVLYFASSGMETTLYMLLVASGALRLVVELTAPADTPEARRPLSLWLLALAALTRPEGVALLAIGCGVRLWRARATGQTLGREALLRCLPAWAPVVGWLLFRRAYYGEWLPNVYYAKPGGLGLDGFIEGLVYLNDAVMGAGTWLVVILAGAAVFLCRPRAPLVALGLLAGAQAAFAVYSTGDWMIEARYALPAVPLVLALAVAGGAALVARYGGRPVLAVACAALVLAFGVRSLELANELERDRVHDHAHRSDGNAALGRWLAEHTAPDATILADEIGAVGHFSGRHIIDKLGLVDPEVAQIFHRHRMNPYSHATALEARIRATAEASEAVMRRAPDVVLLDYEAPVTDETAYDPRFINVGAQFVYRHLGDAYRFVRAFVVSERATPPKSFLIFERATGSPL